MIVKKERLIYFPFEYEAFKPYFEDMARHGWMIKEIKGNWLWSSLVFEQCTPQECYFYTDFSVHSQYFWNTSEEAKNPYYEFVEEYGYHYVCGFKGIVVYAGKQDLEIALRDNSEETKKELRKATFTSLINFAWCGLIELVIIFNAFHIRADVVSSYQGLLKLGSCLLVLLSFIVAVAPVFRWLLRAKKTYHIQTIQRRTMLIFMMVTLWVCNFATNDFSLLFLLYIIAVSLFVISGIRFQIKYKKAMHRYFIYVGIVLFWMVSYFALSTYIPSMQQTFQTYVPPLNKETIHIQSDAHVQLKSQETMLCSYISAQYGSDGFYSYIYVKDTFLKEYLLNKLPHDYEVETEKKRKQYTIYVRAFDVVIAKGQTLLELDKNLYNKLSDKELAIVFTQLANIE